MYENADAGEAGEGKNALREYTAYLFTSEGTQHLGGKPYAHTHFKYYTDTQCCLYHVIRASPLRVLQHTESSTAIRHASNKGSVFFTFQRRCYPLHEIVRQDDVRSHTIIALTESAAGVELHPERSALRGVVRLAHEAD